MIVLGAALVGLALMVLTFLCVALVALLTPVLGLAGAAATIAAICLVVAVIVGLILKQRIADAKRSALFATLATSGVANAALGFAMKRPLIALGVGGGLAAFLSRTFSSKP